MKKLIVWGTILAGAAAAYMMFKRGVPLTTIAQRAIGNPVGSLVSEVEQTA